jgi:hypothetical protein
VIQAADLRQNCHLPQYCATMSDELTLGMASAQREVPMPVTAKLSRKFYDKLGDDVANELVDWLNTVDTSYRQEFKDLFEANFGRLEARMDAFEARVNGRLDAAEARLGSRIATAEKMLLYWTFGFWVGSWAAIVATMVALSRLGVLGR